MSRIAIVGTGIAGMTVARRLHEAGHDISVFEAADRYGGHTATVDVELNGRHYAIDTGFIVFNDWTYPNFIALLGEIGAGWQWSNMSFSMRCERTGLEYNGTSVNSLFAQRRNLLRPSFLRMIADILRFNGSARALLRGGDDRITLSDYLRQQGYSRPFIERYVLPMGRAIWSATEEAILSFPARFFVDFFDRHGFLNVNDRPVWRTVTGGSREYARKLVAPFLDRIRLSAPVARVARDAGGISLRTAGGEVERFEHVFFACHSDQALAILEAPSAAEREVLSAFPYQANDCTLHTDTSLLPHRPLARAAWNYHMLARPQSRVALTYDMNVLQSIPGPDHFLVTLNREQDIDPAKILGRYTYHHPVYTPGAVAAQARRHEVSGVDRTFYCGAYWRYGFHEDGVVSALWALQDFAAATGAPPAQAPILEPSQRAR